MAHSSVWKYFTKCGVYEALCSICMKQFKTGGGTTNLRTHLRTRHPNIFNDPKMEAGLITKREIMDDSILPDMHAQHPPPQFGGEQDKSEPIIELSLGVPNLVTNVVNNGNIPAPKRRKRKLAESLPNMNGFFDKHDPKEDKFDVIGKNIAYKLRDLSPDVSLVAEKLISDILYEAAVGNISKHSRINIFDADPAVVLPMN